MSQSAHPQHAVQYLDRGDWTPEHTEQQLTQLRRRLRRRSTLRVSASLAAVAALVVIGVWRLGALDADRANSRATSQETPQPLLAEEASDVAPGTIVLEDGSKAIPVSADAQIVLTSASPAEIRVTLERGTAEFDVVPNRARRFIAVVGPVEIEVIGTRFRVERRTAQVQVTVTEGLVSLRGPTGDKQLAAGEQGLFALADTELARAEPVDGDASADVQPAKHARISSRKRPDRSKSSTRGRTRHKWRRHAEAADYDAAYAALVAAGPSAVRNQVDDLMMAADTVRLSGHHADALPYLRKVWREHARDPRAPLACFTAGRLLMEHLGRPREAAAAFARVRELRPVASMAQDALAREVEAWYRAGESGLAHDRANEYLRLYPKGRRASAVRRFGGVE